MSNSSTKRKKRAQPPPGAPPSQQYKSQKMSSAYGAPPSGSNANATPPSSRGRGTVRRYQFLHNGASNNNGTALHGTATVSLSENSSNGTGLSGVAASRRVSNVVEGHRTGSGAVFVPQPPPSAQVSSSHIPKPPSASVPKKNRARRRFQIEGFSSAILPSQQSSNVIHSARTSTKRKSFLSKLGATAAASKGVPLTARGDYSSSSSSFSGTSRKHLVAAASYTNPYQRKRKKKKSTTSSRASSTSRKSSTSSLHTTKMTSGTAIDSTGYSTQNTSAHHRQHHQQSSASSGAQAYDSSTSSVSQSYESKQSYSSSASQPHAAQQQYYAPPSTAEHPAPSVQQSQPPPPAQPQHPIEAFNGQVSEGLTPAKTLKYYSSYLTDFEQSEVFDYSKIYCTGRPAAKKIRGSVSNPKSNHGYDDDRGDYLLKIHDHIAYRFEIVSLLGKGSFGQVVKAFDVKKQEYVALKLIRNKKRFHHQALVEVKLLNHLKDNDHDMRHNIVEMYEYFYFRNHLCITFELLSINLYEFIKNNNFKGLSLGLIRRFAIQILQSLKYLNQEHIIHCDMKPENILLKTPNKSGIKIIDFGSSCFEEERIYTYIQSRFYRSPEIILGIAYGRPIDMWSFGCILAELYTGYPIFPGENEVEQLNCIMELFGTPPSRILKQSTRRKQFFDRDGNPRIVPNSRGKKRYPDTKSLQQAVGCNDKNFLSFLRGCLEWDPLDRMTPEEGLRHPWIQEGLAMYHQQKTPQSSRGGGHRNSVVQNGSTWSNESSSTHRGSNQYSILPPITEKHDKNQNSPRKRNQFLLKILGQN